MTHVFTQSRPSVVVRHRTILNAARLLTVGTLVLMLVVAIRAIALGVELVQGSPIEILTGIALFFGALLVVDIALLAGIPLASALWRRGARIGT